VQTIGDVLDRNKGVGPGFDFLRIALALSVVLAHSFQVCVGLDSGWTVQRGFLGPIMAAILPMFFGLSGFLVMGSADRTRNTATFLTFRALRLVPALAVEVTLSALILGTLLTRLPLSGYFSDFRVYEYFGNIIGRVRYVLPGVFDGLPVSGVINANLWTLHAELFSYFLMACLMVTALAYRRSFITALWVTMAIAMTAYNLHSLAYEIANGVYNAYVLVFSFVSGIVAYHWRRAIPSSNWIAALMAILAYGMLKLPYTAFIVHVPLIYLTVWIGSKRLPSTGGDFSYGVYLYSYPIQQTIVLLFPGLREWWLIFPLASAVSLLVAGLSWTFIERPALGLKRTISTMRSSARKDILLHNTTSPELPGGCRTESVRNG